MPDDGYPPGYAPDFYEHYNDTEGTLALLGYAVLASFAAAGIGYFIPLAAASTYGAGVTISGTTYYGITSGQAALIELLGSVEMTGQGAAVLEMALADAGIVTSTSIAIATASAIAITAAAAGVQAAAMSVYFTSGM